MLLLKESVTMQIFATNDDLLKENNVLLFINMGEARDPPPPFKTATGKRILIKFSNSLLARQHTTRRLGINDY